jgi:hypothetical protein
MLLSIKFMRFARPLMPVDEVLPIVSVEAGSKRQIVML